MTAGEIHQALSEKAHRQYTDIAKVCVVVFIM